MHTTCTLKQTGQHIYNSKRWIQSYFDNITLSRRHYRCSEYVVGLKAIEAARREHITSKYWYMIHPLSMFKHYYDRYLIIMLSISFFFKPLHLAFNSYRFLEQVFLLSMFYWLDITLSLIDIIINFMTGYIDKHGVVYMTLREVAWHYITSYFVFDLLSCIPYLLVCQQVTKKCTPATFTVLSIFQSVRLIRLITLYNLISIIMGYRQFFLKSFLLPVYLVVLILHWLACFMALIPLLRLNDFGDYHDSSWFIRDGLHMMSPWPQYIQSLQRCIVLTMCIRDGFYGQDYFVIEEYVLSLFSHVLGYVIYSMFIVQFLMYTGNIFRVDQKYVEMLGQLEHYMNNKQLPEPLRRKMLSCYTYKFRNKFFRENFVRSILSEHLNAQTNIYIFKQLIAKSPLLAKLPVQEACRLLSQSKSEIYFPNDIIMKALTTGYSVFLLAHGCVRLTTASGKELWVLDEGSFFGDKCLMLKDRRRSTNAVALEISEVYEIRTKVLIPYMRKFPDFGDTFRRNVQIKVQYVSAIEKEMTLELIMNMLKNLET
ncbi:potassium/sodium hyperpolarization-activated cyclic nucleotide-gated channel 1-like [Aethina tumida]|uniref:potassium/sodium hyperpolarization-activated cyclic nucleotide-gated channel 1-like n=1 Tax=Aethina tumida TaxID=116153 RepID=UPI002148C5C7|nr:potassium/sodium hyperpolarization-activated cyclic nucleotide-gated channel 1-like [Aethina tumida]